MLLMLLNLLKKLFIPAPSAAPVSHPGAVEKREKQQNPNPTTKSQRPSAFPRLPAAYRWLGAEPGPRHLHEALKLFGTLEAPEAADNPTILGWAKEVGLEKSYSADSIPWCGLFLAVVMKRAGWEPVRDPLWARNWGKFGVKADKPSLGDVLVFSRGTGGHVALYVGESADSYYCLGGNQSDQVNVTRIAKDRCIAVRRPAWRVAQPANVRPIALAAGGALSTNEV